MYGWMCVSMYGWVNGWMGRSMLGDHIDGCLERWLNGFVDDCGWNNGWVVGWIDGLL